MGLSIGLAVSLHIPAVVVLAWALPDFQLGYALVLLPLLAAGPLATRSLSGTKALAAALVAGLASAALAVASLACGSQILGGAVWALTYPASMQPMPEVPHLGILPQWAVTWGQQDLLAAQPVLAVALGAAALAMRKLPWSDRALRRAIPDSLGGRLRFALLGLTALTFVVGWLGFSALEDMHFRLHQLQLIGRWQTTLDRARVALDADQQADQAAEPGEVVSATFGPTLDSLEHAESYPGVVVDPASIRDLYSHYDDEIDAVRDAYDDYRAHPADPAAADEVRSALGALQSRVAADTLALLDTNDVAHHQRLFVVMIVVGIASSLGLWVSRRTTATVTQPIRELGSHLMRVGQGHFDGRVDPHGPLEMRELAAAVNHMTAELERLSDLERQTFQEQLWRQAFHDPLTGLPNRALFRDRLEQALNRADRRMRSIAVLFLDIDNFKLVNDSLGHEQGDALLLTVAERLQAGLRSGDTAARLGGDEFTLLLEDVSDAEDARAVADRVATVLRAPLVLDGQEVFPTASIGIALSTPRRSRPDSLLRDADVAMYHAKTEGKDRSAVFDETMHELAAERLTLEADLRRAVDRGELRVHYQPIVSLRDRGLVEVEALVRWHHPERGLVSPAEFIPVAEATGLIVPIGQQVLEQACRQVVAWQACYPTEPKLVVSVNLSARQFQHPDLLGDIRRAVGTAGLDPRCLKLEITETTVMQNAEAAVATMNELKTLGIQLAIDDFGTGYSSLGYLKRFPIDTLKIDRSFVSGLGQDAQDTAIVRSVLALARSLGLSVTAEGIETTGQEKQLAQLDCDRGQGYLFARPLPASELDAILFGNGPAMRLAA
jgi:diguanylate cyclase (GGDEF)-like protein